MKVSIVNLKLITIIILLLNLENLIAGHISGMGWDGCADSYPGHCALVQVGNSQKYPHPLK